MPDKQHYKIAFAGAPCVGKTTLLYGLERRNPQAQRMVDADETKRIIHIDIPLSQRHFCIAYASGAFVNDTVIPTVLTGATMVVYVVSTGIHPNIQRGSFDEYVACASQVGVHWDNVPWLFVLNTVEPLLENPLQERIPSSFQNTIIHCIAIKDKGIDTLWQQILDTVKSRS